MAHGGRRNPPGGRKPRPVNGGVVTVLVRLSADQTAFVERIGGGRRAPGVVRAIESAMRADTDTLLPATVEEPPGILGRHKDEPDPYPQLCGRCTRVGPACADCVRKVNAWKERQARRHG
jgi:hypothetical protein